MNLPEIVKSLQFTVHRVFKKSVNCQLFTLSKIEGSTVNRKASGFTLIELLVVIAIIASLVAAVTFSWTNAQAKGRDAKRKGDLRAVQQTLEIYYQTNNKYPAANAGQIQCNAGTSTNPVAWGAVFACDPDGVGSLPNVTYMQQLPKDPVGTGATGQSEYNYTSPAGNTTYQLNADIENANDPDIIVSNLPCTPPANYNFCVINP